MTYATFVRPDNSVGLNDNYLYLDMPFVGHRVFFDKNLKPTKRFLLAPSGKLIEDNGQINHADYYSI